jgi:hypothetical protein
MRWALVETAGPALITIVEVEGPTRLIALAADGEDGALERWIAESQDRVELVAAALRDRGRQGGAERQRQWDAALAEDL